jgi:hypothetical protein
MTLRAAKATSSGRSQAPLATFGVIRKNHILRFEKPGDLGRILGFKHEKLMTSIEATLSCMRWWMQILVQDPGESYRITNTLCSGVRGLDAEVDFNRQPPKRGSSILLCET